MVDEREAAKPIFSKSGRSKRCIVGSPNHPSPRDVSVIPSWQTDKYSSR